MKLNIKREVDSINYGIIEVMMNYHSAGESDASNQTEFRTRKKLRKNIQKTRNSEKRSYRRRKDLDEGLIVVEVDGQKIYQCDICKKVCKDRYKLRTHREIHTSTRDVCCNECGAMFKTLTCLYSHKRIHRERIYHQW